MTAHYTERELILAKREAYIVGSHCGCRLCKKGAQEAYPLPPIHREVTLGDGVRVRVKDGKFETLRPWYDADAWHSWGLSGEDVRALMDLLENPMEAEPE